MPNPVYDGDTIYAQSEVLAVRESGSRPSAGIVTIRSTGYTADGTVVIEFERTLMVRKRSHRLAEAVPEPDPRTRRRPGDGS